MTRPIIKPNRPPYGGPSWAPYDNADYRGGGNGGGSTITYAMWNPLDRYSPNANPAEGAPVLSNGNLTGTGGGGWGAVRADIGKTSGDWFFQVTIDTADNSSSYVGVGVATSTASLTYLGDGGSLSWGLNSHGYNSGPSGNVSNGILLTNGDIVGVALLKSTNTAKFYRLVTGAWSLIYSADVSASGSNALYPFLSLYAGVATANFGASAFAAAATDGANEGVY